MSLSAACATVRHLWVDDQISDDSMLLQVGISFLSISVFHLIGSIQVLQRDRGDVDSPANKQSCEDVHRVSR